MASDLRLSDTAANAMTDAIVDLADNGYLRIYDGTRPATADTAISTQVLLAELRFNATAFGAASGGSATANAFTADTSANATGTATWFRALKSDGTTALFDGEVGSGGTYDLVLNTTSIVITANVSVSSMTYTHPKNP